MPSCFVPFCNTGNCDAVRKLQQNEGRTPVLFSIPSVSIYFAKMKIKNNRLQ
jgi:hypothetical protein